MSAPLIGILTSRTKNEHGVPLFSTSEAYVRALEQAGAAPLLIPLGLPQERLADIAARLDAILFSGGGDIAPEQYGSQPHPLVSSVDRDRDRVELRLFEAIYRQQMPFLGICRGLQMINVALGGSLYEDINDQKPGTMKHDCFPEKPRSYRAHPVRIEPGSRLQTILGVSTPDVNSLHHQGIRQLASKLTATAYSPDGIIEAVELPGYPFGMAVQWHPEWLLDDPAMRLLFEEFVRAAHQPNTNTA